MDPTGPSQPSINMSYDHPSNPASQNTEERNRATATGASQQRSDPTYSTRQPDDVDSKDAPMPSSLGYGERDARNDKGDAMGDPVSNTEGEQMRAAGDGDIAKTQDRKHGFGEQGSLTAGLDRKKAEQNSIKEKMAGGAGGGGGGVDVGAAVGGNGGGFVGADNSRGSEIGGGPQSSHEHV